MRLGRVRKDSFLRKESDMDFVSLLAAYAAVAPAEIADRTFILSALLGSDRRWSRWAVFIGGGLAFAVTMGVVTLIGDQATRLPDVVRLGIMLVLFVIGAIVFTRSAMTWEPEDAHAKKPARSLVGQVLLSVAMLGFAEIGDKSQFAAAGVAGATGDFVPVLLGSWLAMMTVVGLGLFAAMFVRKYIPPKIMLWIGAGTFGLFSLWTAWRLILL